MNSVAFIIEVMVEDYYRENGRKPAGILLGPPEYRQVCHFVKENEGHLKDTLVNGILVTQFRGFPIFLKEMPGVELMLNFEEAFQEAYK